MKRVTFALSIIAAVVFGLSTPFPANALSGSQFEANRIIDDGTFFDAGTMSTSDIQSFLNAKVPTCDTNGQQPSSHWNSSQNRYYTRAEWGALNNEPAPFTCLKDYRQNTSSKPAENGLCNGYSGAANESAADILRNVAMSCGVNPQALLVLLQKEQALVTDEWPWDKQFTKATGFGCPDSAPCNPEYAGFFNQVYYGARQFKKYRMSPQLYSHAVGRTSNVRYNPNTSCGAKDIFIFSSSTAGLYNYTPYQPNPAALNNLYGSGDGCSSYGNRNFWRMFNDWFGATTTNSNADSLNFIRLNHWAGKAEIVSYSSISSYTHMSRQNYPNYPAVAPDGAVVPSMKSNNDLGFVRLNHHSGKVEVITYSAASSYTQMTEYGFAGYPAVPADGSVVPVFRPNGDLSFIRLNHSSGKVEIVTYSAWSGYGLMSSYDLASYPAVPADGSVVPVFRPNGDLSFIRLNHWSGKTEVVTYSASSRFTELSSHFLTSYPAVPADGSVVPVFRPNHDLSFVRLNHWSNKVQVVTYNANGFNQLVSQGLSNYPAVTPDGSVVVRTGR